MLGWPSCIYATRLSIYLWLHDPLFVVIILLAHWVPYNAMVIYIVQITLFITNISGFWRHAGKHRTQTVGLTLLPVPKHCAELSESSVLRTRCYTACPKKWVRHLFVRFYLGGIFEYCSARISDFTLPCALPNGIKVLSQHRMDYSNTQ
jgi:hypothetical protein